MVFRKPYAFLIKNFRLIHLILFILSVIVFVSVYGAYGIATSYQKSYYYNYTVTPISGSINSFTYLTSTLLIAGLSVVAYLLYYKKKPFIEYVIYIGIYLVQMILFAFVVSFFNDIQKSTIALIDIEKTRLVCDFLRIAYILNLPIMGLLFVKMIGLDLKRFGFSEDKDILVSEDDDDEVELDFNFDSDKYIRIFNRTVRYLRYWVIEFKKIIIPVVIVLLLVGLYRLYIVVMSNRVYKMNDSFSFNGFTFHINNSYFTNKDYLGNNLFLGKGYEKGYIGINLDVTANYNENNYDYLDLDKWTLNTDKNVYSVNRSDCLKFEDFGNCYINREIYGGESTNILLLFEIDPSDYGKIFYLKYTAFQGINVIPRRIKLDIKDLSYSENYDTKKLKEFMDMEFFDKTKISFAISKYEFTDKINYNQDISINYGPSSSYQKVKSYEGLKSKGFVLMFHSKKEPYKQISGYEFTDILDRYAYIYYKKGDEIVNIKTKRAIESKYNGNQYVYLEVPREVESSSYIEIKFTLRDKLYSYILKDDKGVENSEI